MPISQKVLLASLWRHEGISIDIPIGTKNEHVFDVL